MIAATDIVRVERLPAEPWKNRGGTTRAIAALPAGAGFDAALWRVDRDPARPWSMLVAAVIAPAG